MVHAVYAERHELGDGVDGPTFGFGGASFKVATGYAGLKKGHAGGVEMKLLRNAIVMTAAAAILAPLVSSCGSYEASEVVSSPDGTMEARTFIKDGAAAIANRVYVELSLANHMNRRPYLVSGMPVSCVAWSVSLKSNLAL